MKTPGTSHHYNAGGGGNRRGSMMSDGDSRVYIPSISSEEILDENSRSQNRKFGGAQRAGGNRKVLVVGLLVFVAIAGAIVAYMVTSGGSDSASTSSGDTSSANNGTSSGSSSGGSTSLTTSKPSVSTNSSEDDGPATVLSDPNTGSYPLTAFAIGDWGSTEATKDSCCQRRKGIYNAYDLHAEAAVTKLMDKEAVVKKPEVVISHGDNFYWTGIDGEGDKVYRFELTFETRHNTPAMNDVPWINVMGNHDYGGGSYICMTDKGRRECNDANDLVSSLQQRFELQSSYKSPHDNRWIMKDHFYVYTIEKDGVSIDIFNLDMNDAESHGAHEICCQCYDITQGDDKKCKNLAPTDANCARGNLGMYNACVGQFKKWGEEARTQLMEQVKNSKATWKIVNSHYNPYGHYGEKSGMEWLNALKEAGEVHVWLAGHTHAEKHDYVPELGVHFIENGAGGGIQSEAPSGVPGWMTIPVERLWTGGGLGGDGGNTYGFFALDASKDWLKVRYMTFGDGWNLDKNSETMSDGMVGGVATGYCWYIPSDGSKGQAC